MITPTVHHRYSFTEYLDLDEASNIRLEYFAGEIYGMAGGTPDHAALAMSFGIALGVVLRDGPGRIFSSDLRIRVLATGLATYPDVSVVCGPLERDPESRTTVTNPRLVAEVTSEGTEAYDRGDKLEHYKSIPALMECVLISHREPRVEIWRRGQGNVWTHAEAVTGGTIRLESLGCEVAVDDLYRGNLEDSQWPDT